MAKLEIKTRDCERVKVFYLGPTQYWVSLPPNAEWLLGSLAWRAGIPQMIHTHTRETHSVAAQDSDTYTPLFLVLLPAHTGFPGTGCYCLLTSSSFLGELSKAL